MDEIMSDEYEDDVMESSSESIGPRYQKIIGCEKLLPYADRLDDESDELLADIKGNLGRAVVLRRLRCDCVLWTFKLRRFLNVYGYKFSKEDHVAFVELMYELVTIPNLEPYLIGNFGKTLIMLLNKPELISPVELELPWEPLYKLVKRVLYMSQSAQGIYRNYSSLGAVLGNLVIRTKLYFPVTATQEMLDEFRPELCPMDAGRMTKTMEMIEWFLPVRLFPKDHHLGHELWFEEFMSLWESCHNAPKWDQNMMWLIAKLASNNIGYIDWEPYIPLMYTRFVRCLNLPVFYKQINGGKGHKFETLTVAVWIVSTLGNGSSGQTYLEKFLKTIETYFHQANCGPWVLKLKEMLEKLALFFILRIHKERFRKRSWVPPTPDSHKLTDADIDVFVKAVMPVAMTAMFSKIGVNEACNALQHLASVRPNLVIPDVIERMYSTLDSLTEPHKMTAAMFGMAAVARPMVQGSRNENQGYGYAEGPSHVIPLLFSFLPGIDANDAKKCFVTFRLITIYAALVPFVDTSRCTAPMDENERFVNESTSRFEDFVVQFFDRVFSLIESSTLEFLSHENRAAHNGKSKLETMAEGAIANVCSSLLMQTSDAIFQSALHKLRSFVNERVLETTVSGQLAATVCRVFARVNGRETLRALLPGLSEIILELVAEGEEVLNEENLDNRLLYAMLLLLAIIGTQGNNLSPYIDTLEKILDKILRLKSREGSQIATRILKSLFCSLSSVSACKFTTNGRDYNDPEYPYARDWGVGADSRDVNLQWYVPGDEEIATLQALFSRYVPPELAKIQRHTAKTISLSREELSTSLSIISSALQGAESFYPLSADAAAASLDPRIAAWTSFLPTLGVNGEIRMPDGGNVRDCVTETMSQLQEMMLSISEDDTKSLFVLVRIWSVLLMEKYRQFEQFEIRYKNFKLVRGVLKNRVVKRKGHLGGMFTFQEAELHHERRTQTRFYAFTEAHGNITLELFKLATSRYADVRSKAQDVLISTFGYFPYSYTVIAPKLLEILATDPEENHEAHKGLLYLLGHQSEPVMAVRDWNFLRTVWPAVIMSKPSEKLSVIRLKENLVQTVNRQFKMIAIRDSVPEACVSVGRTLWRNSPRPRIPLPSDEEIRRGAQELDEIGKKNEDLYDGLLNDLLRSMSEKNPHWRHRSMAMSFIRDLVHPDRAYPAKVVRYFLNALVHESLEERKIAAKTVVSMLSQQKRKHVKIEADLSELRSKGHPLVNRTDRWYPGVRSDNVWLQYNYETRPLSEDQWNESRYVHDPWTGYYTWPKKLEVYAPSSQQPSFDPSVRVLTDREREVDRFFSDPRNIEKIIRYNSLEERKGKDKFSTVRAQLFKGLFRNHGTTHLKYFIPDLRRLVSDHHESNQRCAAEIIAGLVKGAKHWPFDAVAEMWREITPIVRTALNNLTVETMADWAMCFSTAQERRDPNRHHWLLECLMEEPPLGDATASSVECGRLYVLQTVLGSQSWRLVELTQRLVARIEERLLTNPFQNVRGRLGSLLSTVYAQDIDFPGSENDRFTPRARRFLERIMPTLRRLTDASASATRLESAPAESSNVSSKPITESSSSSSSSGGGGSGSGSGNGNDLDSRSIDPTSDEQTLRVFKTICKWIVASACRLLYGALPEFYDVLPIVCQLENCEADEELGKTCSVTLAVLAQALALPRNMDVALKTVKSISRGASWSSRAACLSFMEVLVFYNMGIVVSRPAWLADVQAIVLRLLEDERIEVREKAARVLGGLLHCAIVQEQETLLNEFKLKSRRRIKKRDDVRLRHAGVLGLCAFVRAHPYDVPGYVPSVFEHLGDHLNDPQPIPTTIRKTLGDFKRTHYDGWTAHALRFTEEQLGILQDLTVPPSYYA